jgi:4-aminobutyrate aminotransferase
MIAPTAKAASPAVLLQLLRRARTNSMMVMATSSNSTFSTFPAASSSSSASTSTSTPATLESLALSDPPRAAHAIRAHLSKGVAALSQNIAVSASGSRVLCSNGRNLLDMASGIGVLSTGSCHPRVSAALADQASTLVHAQQNIFSSHLPLARLVDRLLEVTPRGLTTFLFANSGSEAVDNAVKLARAATGKQNVISFDNSFHGRTMGAMALTNSKTYYRKGFGPLMGGTFATRYPYCLRCSARAHDPQGSSWYKLAPNVPPVGDPYADRKCCQEPLDALRWLLKQQTAPEETAAIIVEPILGEGGFLTPPPGFLDGVRKICDDNGILLILDEVQSGVARSGTFWAHSQLMEVGSTADILVFAKGIASGFPFAGLASRPELHENLTVGTFGGTYGANALGCAAAAATLDVIEEEDLVGNARERGTQLAAGLVEIAGRFRSIVDVRGRGLMAAVEFGGGGVNGGGGGGGSVEEALRIPAKPGIASAVAAAAGERGMILMTAGARESVRFLPPLTVSAAEVDEALGIFEKALGDVEF